MTCAHRARLAIALAGVAATALGLLLFPAGSGSLAATARVPSPAASPTTSPTPTPTPSPSPSHRPKPRRRHSGTTVIGPPMFDPVTGHRFARNATVTVSLTKNLVNEVVQVSWTGFTPSSDQIYDQTATDYPVMVAECNTPRPMRWNQCYGANNGGVQGAFGPFGPMNTAYATTAGDGTGQLDIQILTLAANANQFLGCAVHHSCSLVIVPSQGGNALQRPVRCADHSQDAGGTDLGQLAFNSQTGECSWRDRIVVPLTFAAAPSNCSIKNPAFTAIGSPMLARVMDSWRAGLCSGSSKLALTYNSALTEPEAIADLPSGLGDIALTTRPGPATIGVGKTYTYAPVAISAVSIAYWFDNPVTGQPYRTVKLDPRLVAKLLTQSYDFENDGCGLGKPHKSIGCDSAVDGNPLNLFDDPEFKRLNPKVRAPSGYGAAFQVPTVESGHSDMTWEVTRWIAHDKAANGFVAGQFDPWGMHLNTDYLGLKYPLDSFTGQDSYPVIAHKYSPVFPLSAVAQYQAENWDPGTDWEKDIYGNFPKDPIEVPGERGLIAILDQADALAFHFPVAQIQNNSGHYVAPSAASMAAALPSMIATGGNKITQHVDYNKQSAGAYPLTMVIYALVPTSGVSKHKAAAIARFLSYIAGPGQVPGLAVGQLPPGYLPLSASLRAQTLRAAALVLGQRGNAAKAASASPNPPGPGPTASPTLGQGIVTVAFKHGPTSGLAAYTLPALLIVGGATTLGGVALLIVGTGGAVLAARVRRVRRLLPVLSVRLDRSKSP